MDVEQQAADRKRRVDHHHAQAAIYREQAGRHRDFAAQHKALGEEADKQAQAHTDTAKALEAEASAPAAATT